MLDVAFILPLVLFHIVHILFTLSDGASLTLFFTLHQLFFLLRIHCNNYASCKLIMNIYKYLSPRNKATYQCMA